MKCEHWKECGVIGGGCCDLHGAISFGVCCQCPDDTTAGAWKAFLREHKIGTRLAMGLSKIPGVKNLPCYDKEGNLKPESGCGGRRRLLDGEA